MRRAIRVVMFAPRHLTGTPPRVRSSLLSLSFIANNETHALSHDDHDPSRRDLRYHGRENSHNPHNHAPYTIHILAWSDWPKARFQRELVSYSCHHFLLFIFIHLDDFRNQLIQVAEQRVSPGFDRQSLKNLQAARG